MAFARLDISKFSRKRMLPDSPYDTRLGRESGKLTSAPPKNFVARTPMIFIVQWRRISEVFGVAKFFHRSVSGYWRINCVL